MSDMVKYRAVIWSFLKLTALQITKLERIYNPIAAMGVSAMFTFQLNNTNSQWPDQLILVSFYYFDAPRAPRGV